VNNFYEKTLYKTENSFVPFVVVDPKAALSPQNAKVLV